MGKISTMCHLIPTGMPSKIFLQLSFIIGELLLMFLIKGYCEVLQSSLQAVCLCGIALKLQYDTVVLFDIL